MGGPIKGRADYYKFGDFNAACSMCGRKRKASELVRNWQGLFRCPEHNEPRQPQDFARGVPDKMGVPWAQPETDIYVGPTIVPGFPVSITPNPLQLGTAPIYYVDETFTNQYVTEDGADYYIASGAFDGEAFIVLPDWVIPTNFAWSWQSGGAGIVIEGANQAAAVFVASGSGLSGLAQCIVQNNLGGQAIATVQVKS